MAYEETLRLKLELDSTDIGSELAGIRQSVATAVSGIDISSRQELAGGLVTSGSPASDPNSLMWGLGIAAKQMAGDVAGFGSHVATIGRSVGAVGSAALGLAGMSLSIPASSAMVGLSTPLAGDPIEMGIFDPMIFSIKDAFGFTSQFSPGISQAQSRILADNPELMGGLGTNIALMEGIQAASNWWLLGGLGMGIGKKIAGSAGLASGLGGMLLGGAVGLGVSALADYFILDPVIGRMNGGRILDQMMPRVNLDEAYEILGGTPWEAARQKMSLVLSTSKENFPKWMLDTYEDTPYGEVTGKELFLLDSMSRGLLERGASGLEASMYLDAGAFVSSRLGISSPDQVYGVMQALDRGMAYTGGEEFKLMTQGTMNLAQLVDPTYRGALNASLVINQSLSRTALPSQNLANAQFHNQVMIDLFGGTSDLYSQAARLGLSSQGVVQAVTAGALGGSTHPLSSAMLDVGAMILATSPEGMSGEDAVRRAGELAESGDFSGLSSAISLDMQKFFRFSNERSKLSAGDLPAASASIKAGVELMIQHLGMSDVGNAGRREIATYMLTQSNVPFKEAMAWAANAYQDKSPSQQPAFSSEMTNLFGESFLDELSGYQSVAQASQYAQEASYMGIDSFMPTSAGLPFNPGERFSDFLSAMMNPSEANMKKFIDQLKGTSAAREQVEIWKKQVNNSLKIVGADSNAGKTLTSFSKALELFQPTPDPADSSSYVSLFNELSGITKKLADRYAMDAQSGVYGK